MKRFLTPTEINYIISDIKPIQSLDAEVGHLIHKKIMDKLEAKLRRTQIYPNCIDEIKKTLTTKYYQAQVDAGDSVGILAAQSIGERQTQLALDSFHSTGITTLTIVAGMPRFNELINVTKNPKNIITTIRGRKNYYSIGDIRQDLGSHLESITMARLVTKTKICKYRPWYPLFFSMYPADQERYVQEWEGIRYVLDRDLMFMYNITLQDVVEKIKEIADEDIVCIWSPDYAGIIDIYNYTLPTLQFQIKGIEGITNVCYTKDLKTQIWNAEASGCNLKKLLAHPKVDPTRTYSNHMWEIYETLGLEAVREFLVQEFMNVISVESYINLRHVQLLTDVMLYTGTISSISRYGVHRNQAGVLTMCSFEESLDQLMKAGIYGEKELIKGVSGAIICGKVNPSGTGLCDVLYAEGV